MPADRPSHQNDSRGIRPRVQIGLFVVAALVVAVAGARIGLWTMLSGAIIVAMAGLLAMIMLFVEAGRRLGESETRLAQLQFQHSQHEAAEQMASLGLWALDLHGNHLHWSTGAFRVHGADAARGEPPFDEFLNAIHADDRNRWIEAHRRAIRRGRPAKVEYRFRVAPAREVWLRSIAQRVRDPKGRPTRLEGTVQDISGIRAMQRQLAASEAKFRDLTHLSSDWIWETDERHRVTGMSDSVDTVLGPWARSIIGRRRWENGGPDPYPIDWAGLRKTLEARKPVENFEFSRLDDKRRVLHLSMSGRPIFDESNRFIGYRGTGHNITLEKQQRMLLEMDGDMAAIMREHTEPQRVVTAIIIAVCRRMAWMGGMRLNRRGTLWQVRERWGHAGFVRMVANLPSAIDTEVDAVESRVWETGKAVWLADVALEESFARRYHVADMGARAAFIAPISNEQGVVLSELLFLAPVGYRDDEFLAKMAAVISRTLSLYLQRTHAQRRLHHASLHDALTGLPNRTHATRTIESMLNSGRAIALLYIDLDRYKLINDTLGHAAGDRALVEIARRLSAALPDQSIAARMGGDEFVAIIGQPGGHDDVAAIARRILQAIEQPLLLTNRAYFLSASIGIAMAPQDCNETSALIQAADAAMYQVKSEGRNDLRFFAGDRHGATQRDQMQLASELPLAMRRGEVELFYQPVMAVGSRNVVCLEGLIRWRHPTLGLLLPERFLGAAEQSNLIREIDFWAIRRAIRDRMALGLDGQHDMAVSVNVSVRQLAEEGFLQNLFGLLQTRHFPAHLLRLEITESSFIEHPERTVGLITELRRIGVRVVIDNFGTGYSSLSHVKNLPVDGLKIDRAFVSGLPHDRGNVAIVEAICTLAGRLGMQAMAEGVETAAELHALREMNCDIMQGSLISPALPLDELRTFLDTVPSLRTMHVPGNSMTLQ